MARSVDRIEQDLAGLEEAIAFLRAEFHNTYSQYLKLLGKAVRQQLILAGYHVCTQGYPESFLALSFSQRQNLQQEICKRGGRVQEELLSHLEPLTPLPETGATDIVEETVSTASLEGEQTQEKQQSELPQLLEVSTPANTLEPPVRQSSQPDQLQEWQEQLEEAIAKSLQNLSLASNRLLQTNGIIPSKLPPAVLEAAIQVEASAESTVGSPNLLNLLMEAESENETEDSNNLMRIVAINLRLSEIEFGDPTLSAGRNQIRKLSSRLNTLQREYHKKQRERAVAQAEAAWRSSWFDD